MNIIGKKSRLTKSVADVVPIRRTDGFEDRACNAIPNRCGADASANAVLLQDAVEGIIDAMNHTDRANKLASCLMTLTI